MANYIEYDDPDLKFKGNIIPSAATTDVSGQGWVTDEDDMASNDDTKVPTEQSVKAYADTKGIVTTTIASSATPTPARASEKTELEITALAEAATFGEPTGTPVNGDLLLISVTDDGTGRAIGHNAIYSAPYSADLFTTTTANKTFFELFRYSSARTKWELLYADEEA